MDDIADAARSYIGGINVGRAKSQPQNSPAIHRRIAGLVRWNQPEIGADDRHAVADLVARRRREILRRLRGLHDRRCVAADLARVSHRAGGRRHHRCRKSGGHSLRCRAARRSLGLFRPQDDVHLGDDHLLRLPGAADPLQQFSLAGDLFVRARSGARLRLSDRAHDHFGEHSELQSRPAGARRLRLPGSRRARRHRRRLSCSRAASGAVGVALDVCHGARAGDRGDHRPLLRGRKRQLARGAWPSRPGRGSRSPSFWCATPQYPTDIKLVRHGADADGEETRQLIVHGRCSTAAIGAPRSSRRSRGSSRISAPTASASSRRSFWRRRWAAAPTMSAASAI